MHHLCRAVAILKFNISVSLSAKYSGPHRHFLVLENTYVKCRMNCISLLLIFLGEITFPDPPRKLMFYNRTKHQYTLANIICAVLVVNATNYMEKL